MAISAVCIHGQIIAQEEEEVVNEGDAPTSPSGFVSQGSTCSAFLIYSFEGSSFDENWILPGKVIAMVDLLSMNSH